MPFVVFESAALKRAEQRYMSVPKKVTELTAWFKQARTSIPSIPNPDATDWVIKKATASLSEVAFQMSNTLGHTATVKIDRTKRGAGA